MINQSVQRRAFANYLAGVERRMCLYLGRIGKFSYPEQRLTIVQEEMAELRRLFEDEASK
jgi:hypothetical protein